MVVRDPYGHSSIVQYLDKYILKLRYVHMILIPQWEWGHMQAQQQLVEYEMHDRLRSFW